MQDMSGRWGSAWGYVPAVLGGLVGKTITAAHLADADGNDCAVLETDGCYYMLSHSQDCCESFDLIDGQEDLDGLVGGVVVVAEEVVSADLGKREDYDDSYTWTLYRFRTTKGDCTLRFYGTSNGYYGEAAELRVSSKEAE